MTNLAINPEQTILTEREAEAVFWYAQGKTKGEIATILGKSVNTIKTLMHNSAVKCGAFGNSAHLVAEAFCRGVLKPLAIALFVMGADLDEHEPRRPPRGGARIVRLVRGGRNRYQYV